MCANDPIFLSYVDLSFKSLDNNSLEIPRQWYLCFPSTARLPGRCTLRFPSSNQLTSSTQLLKIDQTRGCRLISIPIGLDRIICIFHPQSTGTRASWLLTNVLLMPLRRCTCSCVDWYDPVGPHFVMCYRTTLLACLWTVRSTRDPTIHIQQPQRDYPEYRGGRAKVAYQREHMSDRTSDAPIQRTGVSHSYNAESE
jgi:hypothetical protein